MAAHKLKGHDLDCLCCLCEGVEDDDDSAVIENPKVGLLDPTRGLAVEVGPKAVGGGGEIIKDEVGMEFWMARERIYGKDSNDIVRAYRA